MKAKLTDRDWTLIAGILVAVIVVLILFIFNPGTGPNAEAATSYSPSHIRLSNLLKWVVIPGKHSIEALFQLLF